MAVPDARTRNKIRLSPTKVSVPGQLLQNVLVSNVLYVSALYVAKEYLLSFDVGIFWVVMRVLACGGLGVIIWEGLTGTLMKKNNWSALGFSSVLVLVQQGMLYTALNNISSTRVIMFTHFSTIWVKPALEPTSLWKSLAIGLAFVISMVSDVVSSDRTTSAVLMSYGALVIYGLASIALEHVYGVLSPSVGSPFVTATSTLGAALLGLPLYAFRKAMLGYPPSPIVPLSHLATLPLLTYVMLFLTSSTTEPHLSSPQSSQYFMLSFPSAFITASIIGSAFFSHYPSLTDFLIASMLYYGMHTGNSYTLSAPPGTASSRLMRTYLKTILANPESRKIFYFLMLNMCYMLIQMLYGVWTNSLGLISDAIHMAFDCMAIGVGLFASIMATWPSNERFTYGYGRIETLSGFANGIFLILISVFIVFEAIQRILDPPEMNTSQLLLVSSLGLGINLFGMFAMGGHHHHHHGHHDHHDHGDHDHSHPTRSIDEHHAEHQHGVNDISETTTHSHSSGHSHVTTQSHLHSPVLSNRRSTASSVSSSRAPSPKPHLSGSPEHEKKLSRAPSRSQEDSEGSQGTGYHETVGSQERVHHMHDSPEVTERGKPLADAVSHHHENDNCCTKEHDHGHHPSGPTQMAHHDHSDHHSNHEHHDHPHTHHTHDHSHHNHSHHDHSHDDHSHDDHSHQDHSHHDHDHGHSHHGHSHNMRGVFLHVMADTLGSVGVIVSTLLIQFYGWTGFDPIASLFIAVLIAASVIPLVIDTGKVLCLDVGDRETSIQAALSELNFVEGVHSYTYPRFWPKDPSSLIGSIHIQLTPSAPHDPTGTQNSRVRVDRIVERVKKTLRHKIGGLEELTIQVDG
ncbi:hypothetical protein SERLA73DRAFT_173028 [Serpula lacrymans var. lacrymans S7.3]|uniref:Cation efflux protein transmembrane domain-containing protein n=2 Tax=Serpula lacrymans var. lacrymans TaxID=341189 RepID=F8QHG1_SERL3|nr:uncharacterized protein SERLADRAFT_451117 [Serpula lacrymans var. lacrymans S7.9]EGN92271.1 hypothetical protein SERLA73DRAFT_173028 [Serpula lacrymans var. lacrymans S7.3]EGO22240.1 hypothetical protein SERLADRAFT_451117 [Serpula lacrymans var. lacrymans S7.9]